MNSQTDAPWWKFPLMWLVIGLPACVVLAGLGTVWIALRTPDSVLESPTQRSLVPAQAGRNHAMTPGATLPSGRDGQASVRP